MEEKKIEKKHNWFYILIGLMVVFVMCGIIGSCLRRKSAAPERTTDPNIIFTQVAQTVMLSMTQTSASDPNAIHTQVAGTMMAQAQPTAAPQNTPTPQPKIVYTNTPSIRTSFGDGMWMVGVDIQPGTYRSSGGENCYWERLSGFTGAFDEIIANDNIDGPTIITILPSDKGFSSQRCGTWTIQ